MVETIYICDWCKAVINSFHDMDAYEKFDPTSELRSQKYIDENPPVQMHFHTSCVIGMRSLNKTK